MTVEEVDERIDMKLGIVMEELDHKFRQLLEAMGTMIEVRIRPIVQDELVGMKEDMKVVKAAVKETSHDIKELKQHVAHLEQAIE